jgi:cytochrome P450
MRSVDPASTSGERTSGMTQAPPVPLHMRRDGFDPAAEVTRIQRDEGVVELETVFGAKAFLVTRYSDVREVLADATRFSNAGAFRPPEDSRTDAERERDRAGMMLAFDPPEHTRLRRMLTPEFTVHRMRRLEPRIVEIVADHLDELERTGSPADLVPTFTLPIPSLVICELLGVPYADRAGFQARTGQLLDLSLPMDRRRELAAQDRAYMDELVSRAQAEPGADMLGMLVREHGSDLTRAELRGIGSLLLIAGHETTSNMLGLGTLALLRHPDQLAAVRDDPRAAVPAVEELLRWISIVHSGVVRTTTTEVEIAGRRIGAGELVLCALPAANRDPALIADPQRLDVRRGVPGHVAFGHGLHHCLGAPLARMELRIAFPALLRRFPKLALAVPYADISFRAHHFVYGLHALPVTW